METNSSSAGMLTFDCSERDIDSVVKSDTVVPWGDLLLVDSTELTTDSLRFL